MNLAHIREVCLRSVDMDDDAYMEYIKLVTPDLIIELTNKVEELQNLIKSLDEEHHQVVCSLYDELDEKIELLKKSEVFNGY